MKKLLSLLAAALMSTALAHATVKTDAGSTGSLAGKFETYRVQVPAEKGVPTIRIRLIVPEGVLVSTFQPVSGFARAVERDAHGRIVAVTWTGRIRPEEFQRFLFSARNPVSAGTLRWVVEQTYADGTVVRWDDTSAETPASQTVVN